MARIVLASASRSRIALLETAGIAFTARPAPLDERAVEVPLIEAGATPAEIALALAEAKATAVSAEDADALVIGADQTLDLDGARLTKPETMAAARAELLTLSGRTHALHAGLACARGGKVTWHHLESARLTMRALGADFVDDYLARLGEVALTSVGAYQIEGLGIQLFERIDGDYFAILGLPMLPLLAFLRGEAVLA